MLSVKPLSIYIHIPFCKSKCFYCDFASYPDRENIYDSYVDALISEIKLSAQEYIKYEIRTIFIGGGTPTVLSFSHILRIIDALKSNYNLNPNAEITIESNPGTIEYHNLFILRKSGINRLSMGLQAWQNRLLKKLGRIYTQQEFIQSFNSASNAGFENINIDLMFALPYQTIADWEETLSNVIALKPAHISTYSLIIEAGTPFGDMYSQNKLKLPTEDIDRQMYYIAKKLLKDNGYIHYEISNFAQTNFESRHNLVYWQQKEYIGFGLGAHSFVNRKRFHNTLDINKYLIYSSGTQNIIEDIEINDVLDEYAEYMFLGLRLIRGVSKKEFETKFNKSIYEIYGSQLNECIQLKLLKEDNDFLSLTSRGIDVSNLVFEKFLIK